MNTLDDRKDRIKTLAQEEHEVFRLAVAGYDCLEIARMLRLGRIETLMLLYRVRHKLGVSDRRALIMEYRDFFENSGEE